MRFLRKPAIKVDDTPNVGGQFRVYAVGDIHGCHHLLIPLLDKIAADAELRSGDGRKVALVFLGDYIDRGDDSAQVLETLSKLEEGISDRIVCLRGNHEEALLNFLEDPVGGEAWLNFGGLQTLASFGVPVPSGVLARRDLADIAERLAVELDPYLGFLTSLPLSVTFGDVLFAHAGANPGLGREQNDARSLLYGHPGFTCPTPLPGMRVVHGHYDAAAPVSLPGRLCVDTGAYYSGRLTAVRLDDGEAFIEVDGLSDQVAASARPTAI